MDKEFKEKLLKLYPAYDRVTGPYQRKDKRFHIVLNNSSLSNGDPKKLRTLSYPKALIEVEINRLLSDEETVDHIDENVENNELINLQILTRAANIQKSLMNGNWFQCLNCKKLVYRTPSKIKDIEISVFCSYSCRGQILGNQYQIKERVAQLAGGN